MKVVSDHTEASLQVGVSGIGEREEHESRDQSPCI